MEEFKQRIKDTIFTVKNIVNSLREPIGNDYSNIFELRTESRLLSQLYKLLELAQTEQELIIINEMVTDITLSVKQTIKDKQSKTNS